VRRFELSIHQFNKLNKPNKPDKPSNPNDSIDNNDLMEPFDLNDELLKPSDI